MSDSENEEVPKGSGGCQRCFVKRSEIFLTKNAEGKTVQGITVKPLSREDRVSVDLELQRVASRAALRAALAKEEEKLLANIQTNRKLPIYMEGSCSSSSDEEVCAAEAPISHGPPLGSIPTSTVPSTASLEGIRETEDSQDSKLLNKKK